MGGRLRGRLSNQLVFVAPKIKHAHTLRGGCMVMVVLLGHRGHGAAAVDGRYTQYLVYASCGMENIAWFKQQSIEHFPPDWDCPSQVPTF